MTAEQILALGPAFTEYLRQYDACCDYPQTFGHLQAYCKGLLSDLPRKSAEPIALASGIAVRTLQEFLKDHAWSFNQALDALRRHVLAGLALAPDDGLGTVGIVDETSVVKKGTKTPGVQRQWCGAAGKVENCIVTVHLGVARGRYAALIDAELFLPESWALDRERCREADVPDGMGHRAKWRIALGQVLNARLAGFALDWVTFDEGYGSKPGFLDGLDLLGLSYVGEVPCSFSCFTREPAEGESGHRADDLARHSPVFHGQPWREVSLPRQTLGDQAWHARMAPVHVRRSDGVGVARRWLIVARNEGTGEEKYFICGGREAGLETRLRVGFTRHNVEHGFRIAKTELGFSHYEGRSYVGLMRHMTLCLVTLGFVAGQAAGLRGGKSGGDGGAGVPGAEPRLPAVAAGAGRAGGAGGPCGGDDPVPPAAESGRARITPTARRGIAAGAATRPKTQTAETKTASRTLVAL